MLSYKLAKQLKDAGFAHVIKWGTNYYIKSGQLLYWNDIDNEFEIEREGIGIPTLSELIKACGRIDFKLRQMYSVRENKIFYVIEIPGADDMERCKTPEEAVTKLYIELNKEINRG